jgi:hypothetical protein
MNLLHKFTSCSQIIILINKAEFIKFVFKSSISPMYVMLHSTFTLQIFAEFLLDDSHILSNGNINAILKELPFLWKGGDRK